MNTYPNHFFPFSADLVSEAKTNRRLVNWICKNEEWLNENHGNSYPTVVDGKTGWYKLFRYGSADIKILSETEGILCFYGRVEPYGGWTGGLQASIPVSVADFDFSDLITQRVISFVKTEQERREETRKQERRANEGRQITTELFNRDNSEYNNIK